MKAPEKGEAFIDVYKRAPLHVKKILDQLKDDCKKYFEGIERQVLIDELEGNKNHHQLMRLCANAFADTELSEQSGYKFYFAEPLIEFLKKEKGIRLFDLLLYNEGENRVILIECKSSVGENQKAQDTLKQIEESKKFVIGKIEYLSECFGIELNPERFEYVSCIYVEDSDKFFQSRSAQEGKAVKKYDPNLVKFWVYIRHNKSVKLHHSQTHSSKDLTRLLIRGFELSELTPHYDLSFYLNMHPFRLILNAIVGYCYNSNLHSSSQDPKKIKKGEIVKLLNSKIRLSAPDNEKKALVEEKVNSIIAYGERYGLFEIISKDEIRIQCYGVQLNTVIDNIKRKYFERWIEEKSEQRCKKRALEQFTQQYYPAHYRRLDYFDPNIDPEIIVAKKSRD